jgi:[pyruvate, water dikinase]-phosphate phosphotransferase / [pyruvate, water dikinase] kinase
MEKTEKPAVYFNVHLVSDSTGETLSGVMRASCSQFENVAPLEHSYYLVRSHKQLERVLREIEAAPGIVMFTMAQPELRNTLERRCRELGCPTVAVLDPVLELLQRYLGVELSHRTGSQHALDPEYFQRVDALNFTLNHDDGHGLDDLEDADVVILGVSRVSKTPTCIYLAHRGVRAANIPLVPDLPIPHQLENLKRPLIVGLKVTTERLADVRRARLRAWNEQLSNNYANEERVAEELRYAAKLCAKYNWPMVDVTRRSIEETAALILNMLTERRRG